MSMFVQLSRWFALWIALVLAAPTALAQDEGEGEAAPELDFAQRVDKFFGDYPNAFLAKVLFFDVVFWDDNLPLGDGVGEVIGDEKVTSFSEETQAYGYQRILTLDAPVLALDQPTVRTFGTIRVEVRQATRRDGHSERPILIGKILEQDVDVVAAGLDLVPQGTELTDAEAIVSVHSLAPFPVRIDRRTGKTLPVDVVMPQDMVPVSAGDMVALADNGRAQLMAPVSEGVWMALDQAQRTDATPLANTDQAVMPFVVLWLVMGSIFFTFRMGFVNLWGFVHAVRVTAGQYDNPDDPGEISHFQALSSALSATVGLGNIAGVAIAVTAGGPGAIFWMIVAGFLGMSAKFTECTLGQMYRVVKPDGTVSGGPMHYLGDGLSEMGLKPLGAFCAWMFAIMCVGGSLGGGNMFQANQSFMQLSSQTDAVDAGNPMHRLVFGLFMAGLVGVVIIGGIKRIGAAASIIVPVMCVMYVAAGLIIVALNASAVPAAIGTIISSAFTPMAGFVGLLGVLAQGFKRASFSSEAGVGSASIAHSAAATEYPVREGVVALLEPFIDTIIVCATTGIVIVLSGVYTDPSVETGVTMTSAAFSSALPGFEYFMTVAVLLFAFSTMISWSYYGERCATWMMGDVVIMPYRVVFLVFVVLGCLADVYNVTDFSDMMILGMAFPNILGAILLSGKVKRALNEYWAKLTAGEFATA
jgi:AGCS family alanine or glycine:cation symporter